MPWGLWKALGAFHQRWERPSLQEEVCFRAHYALVLVHITMIYTLSGQCVRPQRPDTALTKKPSTEPLGPYGLRGGNGGGGDVFDKQICFDLTKCLADQLHVT